jgi:hypothetical protein
VAPPPPPAVKVRIKVTSDPPGAELYTGPNRAGTDGTTFERPKGTKLVVRCSSVANHDPGNVTLVFEQDAEVVCKMKRKGKCVEGLKNPLDECDEDGGIKQP